MAAQSQLDKDMWIVALKEHKRQFLTARIKIFEQKLAQIHARKH